MFSTAVAGICTGGPMQDPFDECYGAQRRNQLINQALHPSSRRNANRTMPTHQQNRKRLRLFCPLDRQLLSAQRHAGRQKRKEKTKGRKFMQCHNLLHHAV